MDVLRMKLNKLQEAASVSAKTGMKRCRETIEGLYAANKRDSKYSGGSSIQFITVDDGSTGEYSRPGPTSAQGERVNLYQNDESTFTSDLTSSENNEK